MTVAESTADVRDLQRVFDGVLDAPAGWVRVETVESQVLCETRVATGRASVAVFTNDPSEPDRIAVAVEPVGT
ncbi:MAG: hypothetical protein U0821_08750 [Chloroflexota bacterium]